MKSLLNSARQWIQKLGDWLKPNPVDSLPLTIVKTIFKTLALLVMIAFSPVILVVLLFVFFAAV